MKEKISITVDKDILSKIDYISNNENRNRSEIIENLLKNSLEKIKINKALILVGGNKEKFMMGKTYKSLLKIDGEEIIIHTVKILKKYGVDEILIIGSFMNNYIFNILGNGNGIGVKIQYLKDENLGTAGAVRLAKKYLQNDFFVILGDIYFDFDLSNMISFHNSHNKLVTLAVTSTKLNESRDNVEIEGNKIVKFEYVPREKSFIVNAGIYIARPEIFDILPNKGSIEREVFPKLSQSGKIVAYNFSGKWRHIHS